MNYEMMKQVAWIGDDLVKGPVRAVILVFHGLSSIDMREGP